MRKLLPLLLLPFLFAACVTNKHIRNFDRGPEFNALMADSVYITPLRIRPDDILVVAVQTVDPNVSAPFTLGGIQAGASGLTNQQGGGGISGPTYLVDANGVINFPVLGNIHLAGLTTLQARDTLAAKLKKYLSNPIVNVRITNFRFTVLGEVGKPGTYAVDQENLSLLAAVGLAGDVTPYGNRSNILVIREIDGKRQYGYLDLHQRDVFKSPFFYLQQNDVVYVEPLRAKIGSTADASTKYAQWAFPVISIISLLVTLFQ